MQSVTSLVVSIASLAILILLHEAGHFLVARACRMNVSKFSVGFGPAIAKIKRFGTEFQIGAIPFGGFVQIDGLNPHDGTDPNAPGSYENKPFWARFATILAGPVMNYLIGFLVLWIFFSFFFAASLAPARIRKVVPGSAAAVAGIQVDDLVIGTNDEVFKDADDLRKVVGRLGAGPIRLRIRRGEQEQELTVNPQPGLVGFRIGVDYEGTAREPRPMGIVDGAGEAASRLVTVSIGLLDGIASLLRPGKSQIELSGPIGMVQALSHKMRTSWTDSISDVGNISIMLGLVNLLPIPSLDGSRLLFLLLGLVRRRRIEPKVEAIVHGVGLVMLLGLLLVISIGDVTRP